MDDKHELTPAIVFHAGDALARAGQREEAQAQFDRLLSKWSQDAWADDALLGKLQLALAAADHQQIDALAADFSRRFADSPLTGNVRRIHSQSLLARKEFDKAAEILKHASPAGQSDRLADQYLLAASHQGAGRYDQALNVLAPVLKLAKGELLADARLLQASVLVAQERYQEAIAPLQAHLAADPQGADSARCRAQLAACFARQPVAGHGPHGVRRVSGSAAAGRAASFGDAAIGRSGLRRGRLCLVGPFVPVAHVDRRARCRGCPRPVGTGLEPLQSGRAGAGRDRLQAVARSLSAGPLARRSGAGAWASAGAHDAAARSPGGVRAADRQVSAGQATAAGPAASGSRVRQARRPCQGRRSLCAAGEGVSRARIAGRRRFTNRPGCCAS